MLLKGPVARSRRRWRGLAGQQGSHVAPVVFGPFETLAVMLIYRCGNPAGLGNATARNIAVPGRRMDFARSLTVR